MAQLTETNIPLFAHPAAELFPPLSGTELAALADDIREHGQTMPIVVWDDRNLVVDGRNRLAACESVGIEPRIERRAFADDAAVAQFIVSANVHRRHLSESQRAAIGARLKAEFFGPTAVHRKITGGRAGRAKQLGHPANLPGPQKCRDSREEVAELLNVSPRLIDAAGRVLAKGAPEVGAAIDAGELTVTAAASMLDRNHDEQRAILERMKTGKARSVRAVLDEAPNQQDAQGEQPAAEAGAASDSPPPRRSRRKDAPHPFHGFIVSAQTSTSIWGSMPDDFYDTPKFAHSTASQRKELIAALKSEIRAANRFIAWLTKQAGRTKSS